MIAVFAASLALVWGAWSTAQAEPAFPTPVDSPATGVARRGSVLAALDRSDIQRMDVAGSSIAPDRTRESLSGRLADEIVGCDPSNAALYECGTGSVIALRALTSIDPSLFGREVGVEGYWADCSGGAGRYFIIESIVPTMCGAPTPTPAPTPIVTRENLALRAPVTASGDVPGQIKEYLTDGDPVSNWHAPPADLAYASIDLGYERAFNSFILRWGESYATRYGIYVWDTRLGERGDWHRVHYVTGGRGGDIEITIARSESRHLLIWMLDSSDPTSGFDLREWEVYGVDSPNMALGCASHVSTAAAGFPGWHANDGDLSSSWASDVDAVPADRYPYIYIRCPERIDFSMLRLHWDDVSWPRFYRVGFYQDGRPLPIYFSVDNPDGGLDWMSLPGTISIDTVLVFVDVIRPGFRGVRLGEFELYGLPPSDLAGADGGSGARDGRDPLNGLDPRVSIDRLLDGMRYGGFRLIGR